MSIFRISASGRGYRPYVFVALAFTLILVMAGWYSAQAAGPGICSNAPWQSCAVTTPDCNIVPTATWTPGGPTATGTLEQPTLAVTPFCYLPSSPTPGPTVSPASSPTPPAGFTWTDQACYTFMANGCNANDVKLSRVTNLIQHSPCNYPGEEITVSFVGEFVSSAQARYDVGVWTAQDGGTMGVQNPTALVCAITMFPNAPDPPWKNLDADVCGDIAQNSTYYHSVENLPVTCIDTDGDGYLDVNAVLAWDNNAGTTCNSPPEAVPGTSSKCRLDTIPGLTITVAPQIVIDKVTYPSGETQQFTFDVSQSSTTVETFALADGDDPYAVTSLQGGLTYAVAETVPTGWVGTDPDGNGPTCSSSQGYPDPSYGSILLHYGETVTCTFPNTKLASITAHKFYDDDTDGLLDAGEASLPGWQMSLYSDAACNTGYPSGAPQVGVTDATGDYVFTNLPPGTYYVQETNQSGWTETVPTGGSACREVTVEADDSATVNIGNAGADLDLLTTCPDFYTGGPTYDYTIEVTNTGPFGANTLQMVDALPSEVDFVSVASSPSASCSHVNGTVTCDVSSLAAAAVWTVTITVQPDTSQGVVLVQNTASVSASTHDPDISSNEDVCASTLPVTLSHFTSGRMGADVRFAWSTSTEAGNAGFNVFADEGKGLTRLNDLLIPTLGSNSLERQDYRFAARTTATQFWLQEVSVLQEGVLHGPFHLGETLDVLTEPEMIDWEAIQLANVAKATVREDQDAQRVNAALASAIAEGDSTLVQSPVRRLLGSIAAKFTGGGPDAASVAAPSGASSKNAVRVAEFGVTESGIHRVTYEALLGAGIDLEDQPAKNLALTVGGAAVPIRVGSGRTFGPGSFFEFLGESLDTVYTDRNNYTLWLDKGLARRIRTAKKAPDVDAEAPTFYMETAKVNRQRSYSFAAPGDDPWLDHTMLVHRGGSNTWHFGIELDDLVPGTGQMLEANLWGVTDFPHSPDHHTVVSFNGQEIADVWFNGQDPVTARSELDQSMVWNGSNTLTVRLPGDLPVGVDFDMSQLDSYSITYPRAFVARQGRLTFDVSASVVRVDGLPPGGFVAYRTRLGKTEHLGKAIRSGGSVVLPGHKKVATYEIAAANALLAPGISPAREWVDITSAAADYVVIAHPDFINADLDRLVRAREAQALTVKVVDVDDVYVQFGHGVFDAAAIRDYIGHAVEQMDTQYVLLVGGDTYDYRGYSTTPGISFVPSLYAATDAIVKQAPVDALYADIDDDGSPDVSLGRLPVRTGDELAAVIDNTLAYERHPNTKTALFVTDAGYGKYGKAFTALLSPDWTATGAHIDDDGAAAARATLLGALNDGVALASFVGHSDSWRWTRAGLFDIHDAEALTNFDKPSIVTQWGCWNAYYVEPTKVTLSDRLLLSGNRGAAAVLGSVALSYDKSERALGLLLMPELVRPGNTIGAAVRNAKTQLHATNPEMTDVLLGWTLLGDPALVANP